MRVSAFLSFDVLAPDGSHLVAAVIGLSVAWLVFDRLRRGRRPGAPRRGERPRSRVPPATRPGRVCRGHKGKRIFATEADAEDFVAWSRRKAAAGRWEGGAPMDHGYACPLVGADHWHVSSKPRRP